MINSIDCEGTMKGPDYELAQKVNDLTRVPIIFSGVFFQNGILVNLLSLRFFIISEISFCIFFVTLSTSFCRP